MDLAYTLLGDPETRMSDKEFAEYKHVFVEYVQRGKVREAVMKWYEQSDKKRQDTWSKRELLFRGESFHTDVGNLYATGWRFCRMRSGRSGWVPEHSQVGDEVFVVYGSRVPFLLRSVSEDKRKHEDSMSDGRHYSMVGTCYVQGIMDGEAVAGDHECEIIYLH